MSDLRPDSRDALTTVADEARFADSQYAAFADSLDMNPSMWRKYAHPESLWDHRQLVAILLGDMRGKLMLDLGCGMGEEAVYFAKLGARVVGVDVSRKGIEITRRRAHHNGVAASVEALVMRADRTEFPADHFDLVHGLGILHHIGVDVGLREVRRVLKRGGIGVFYEPLGDSPALESTKRWIMSHFGFMGFTDVTDHEENLKLADVERAGARFSSIRIYPLHLFYRGKRFVPKKLRDLLRRIDSRLLAVAPSLRHFAGAVVIKVRK